MSGTPAARKSGRSWFEGKKVLILLFVLYAVAGSIAAVEVIDHTTASTNAIENILKTFSLKNEGEKSLEDYKKEHPILGFFISGTARSQLDLPSAGEANEALYGDAAKYLKDVRIESSRTAWWSWALLSLSLLYVIAVVARERSFQDRGVLFALNTVALVCFVIGILAPALVIWTAPSIPMETGKLEFVVQYQIRGIAAIIWDLFTNGHFIIGGFLFLFSIATPMTKCALTYFVTTSRSKELNYKIGEFVHTIGKWSMADVFVGAVLLSLYALKYQEATKSIPCLGLYYFIGYCLLSLSTTELLVHSGAVAGVSERSHRRVGAGMVGGLVAGLVCFAAASGLYTYEQYTVNTKQKIESTGSPQSLNNADLVLPGHKSDGAAEQKK
jgi:paraquat-inducible protein A